MGAAGGPNIEREGLVFGYDTGYGVADNINQTRFYPGEPTTNAVPLTDFINTSNWSGHGWSGAINVSTDLPNTIELTATNGWRTYCIDTGITSGGTVTVSYEYKAKSIQNVNSYVLTLNGTHLGSYTNGLGNGSSADLNSFEWIRKTASWTANSDDKLAIGIRGNDSAGLSDTMYVRNLQVELNGHATPFTATSRSSTESLIDLTESTSINVSNISFDSTGQPTFDGTDDYILTSLTGVNLDGGCTIEGVLKRNSTPTAWRTFFNIKSASANTPFFEFRSNANSQHIYADYYNGTDYVTNAASFTTGTYGHAVATYDGAGNISMYFNGELVHTKTGVPSFALGDSPRLTIGRAYSNDRYVDIDAPVVKVYDQALTAQEIKQNYNAYKNRFDI